MVSDKLSQNSKLGDNLVEYKMCGCLTIEFNFGNNLCPFCEIDNSHNNMMVPPSRIWVTIHKFDPPLGEVTDSVLSPRKS